jgi:RimJ/RimL family protein N-acetyltransferase
MSEKYIEVPMPIRTPRLIIVPAHPDHAEKFLEARNSSLDVLQPWMGWAEKEATLEDQRIMLAKKYHQFLLREDMMLLAFTHEGELVVSTGIQSIDWRVPMAEIGYWCKKSAHRKGYVTEAANALTRYCFDVLKMRKVCIGIDSENAASEAVPKRLNMIKEFEAAGMVHTLHPKEGPLRVRRSYCCFDTKALPPLEVSW